MEDRWIAQGWLERTTSKWMGLRGMKSDEARGVEGGQGGTCVRAFLAMPSFVHYGGKMQVRRQQPRMTPRADLPPSHPIASTARRSLSHLVPIHPTLVRSQR